MSRLFVVFLAGLSFLMPPVLLAAEVDSSTEAQLQKLFREKKITREEIEALRQAVRKEWKTPPPTPIVLTNDRSETDDIVCFRNGDVLRGRILSQSVAILAPYGSVTAASHDSRTRGISPIRGRRR